jgi:hypothetical protein
MHHNYLHNLFLQVNLNDVQKDQDICVKVMEISTIKMMNEIRLARNNLNYNTTAEVEAFPLSRIDHLLQTIQ